MAKRSCDRDKGEGLLRVGLDNIPGQGNEEGFFFFEVISIGMAKMVVEKMNSHPPPPP